MIKVIVSILTYNGGEKTIKTISDIYAQKTSGVSIDIVVIDNNSSNDIVLQIKKQYPSLNIIRAKENLGYSAGHNHAIDLALKNKADFLFVLNDDLQLKSNYVQEMVDFGSQGCDVAAIGSTICLPNGSIQATFGVLKPWFAGVIWQNRKMNCAAICARPVDVVQGAAIVLTKTILVKGFRFDESLFFGGEEYDLACWVRRSSLKIYLLEHIEVVHNTNQIKIILNRWHPDAFNYYYAVRNSFYIKHKYSKSNLEYVIAIGYSLVRILVKGAIFALKGDFHCFKYIWKGICDGISRKMWKLNICQ